MRQIRILNQWKFSMMLDEKWMQMILRINKGCEVFGKLAYKGQVFRSIARAQAAALRALPPLAKAFPY